MTTTENIRSLRSDARRNREAVLAAAQELFAKEGLEAQMPDVARAANVGVGTVYRHFPSKDDLITALVVAHFEALANKARECLGMEEPWDGISEFIRSSAHTQAQDRCLCDVTADRAEMVAGVAFAVGMPDLVDQLVKRAQRAGKLRRDLTWEDIPTIVCGLGTATQQLAGPGVGRWPRLVEVIIDGLRAPGSSKLPPPL